MPFQAARMAAKATCSSSLQTRIWLRHPMMMLSVENNESDLVALGAFDVEEHPVNINATQQRTIRYTW